MRQMIEDAARAAGMMPVVFVSPGFIFRENCADDSQGFYWNPLTDDGDALRLVVRLKQLGLWKKPHIGIQCEGWDADPYAATRLAITRAAASIGEKMRQEDALRQLSKLSDEMGEEL